MAANGWKIFWERLSHAGGGFSDMGGIFQVLFCNSVTSFSAKATPNTRKIWLIPEAAPLAVNIAFVSCLAFGSMAYISSKEPYFFLDKHKRKYGDAVYSEYPMPEPKPLNSFSQKHAN
jgi:hypothetical protein